MPKLKTKTAIDYSTTIIYKITCKDTNIKELYVGHTTNFVQRRQAHKQECINNNACKLYAIIREHGGWNNWIMEIVHFFTCNDQYEARTKEQEYFVLLKATLNSIEPMPTSNPMPKINVIENDSKFASEKSSSKKYHCECCDYGTSRKSSICKHYSTTKHIKTTDNTIVAKSCTTGYTCDICKKTFNDRTGLWRHNKKCTPNPEPIPNYVVDKELVMLLIKENSELKQMMMEEHKSTQQMMLEVIKNITHK
jgi:hypothetical protein